jgi:NADP-dependent 3-hydroxy acid dehydrogenase YdfG
MAIKGKLAVVCGGASGIGKAMALDLLQQGAKVVIMDINLSSMQALQKQSPALVYYQLDVTDLKAVQSVFTQVEKEHGPIFRLVHTAAIMPGSAFRQMPIEQITKVMSVNYEGMVHVTQTVLPFLLSRNEGQLVVLGSVAGVLPLPRFGAYGASKAATNFYMEVLQAEHADSNVQLLLVCPAAVDTPLMDQATENGPWFLRKQKNGFRITSTQQIIKAIERGLRNHKKKVFPGDAWLIQFLYRLFPNLSRWIGQKLS